MKPQTVDQAVNDFGTAGWDGNGAERWRINEASSARGDWLGVTCANEGEQQWPSAVESRTVLASGLKARPASRVAPGGCRCATKARHPSIYSTSSAPPSPGLLSPSEP
jgi:hypothetical protein